MRAYFFILLICPMILFAQREQQTQPTNGATDCPDFSKRKVASKASLFQYMRTHKAQPMPKEQQPVVYRASALPNLEEAQQARNAEVKKNERATAKAQRQKKIKPAVTEEPSEAEPQLGKPENGASPEIAEATPVEKGSRKEAKSGKEKPVEVVKEEKVKDKEGEQAKEESASAEATADKSDAAREKRDKKLKKAAFKSKIQHLFKRTNKPSSRKHVEKCPSF